MSQRLHFISGLPRSGSTLLAALLAQNPRVHAAMTSPLGSLFGAMLNAMSAGNEYAAFLSAEQKRDVLDGMFQGYLKRYADKDLIFDTNRFWCAKLPALATLFPDAKLICCVRNVAWIMDSFERALRRNPLELSNLFNDETERNTVYSRVDTLGQRNRIVGFAWSALKEAFYGDEADRLLLVEYELLAQKPQRTLELVYQFLGEEPFQHDVDNVEYQADSFDARLGTPGLHSVSGRSNSGPGGRSCRRTCSKAMPTWPSGRIRAAAPPASSPSRRPPARVRRRGRATRPT